MHSHFPLVTVTFAPPAAPYPRSKYSDSLTYASVRKAVLPLALGAGCLCAVCVRALFGGTTAHALALSAVPSWRKRVLPRVCARPQANKTQSALFTSGCLTFNLDFSRGPKHHKRVRNALFSLIGAVFKIIAQCLSRMLRALGFVMSGVFMAARACVRRERRPYY